MESRYTREDLERILSKITGQPFNKKREEAIRALLASMPEKNDQPTTADEVLAAAKDL